MAAEKGIYRTTFRIPDAWKDKRVFVVFDGSMTDTKVMVNGKQAGDVHQGAFYRFKREITDLVDVGPANKLEVEVSKMSANTTVNAAEREADFWVFGGIFRPVYLEAVPKTHVEYSGIDAKHNGDFNMEVILDKEIANANLRVDIFEVKGGRKVKSFQSDPAGKTARLQAPTAIPGISAWSPESPQLYNAVITIEQRGKPLHQITSGLGSEPLN